MNDFGSFCPQCLIVVLDRDRFSKQLAGLVKEESSGGALRFEFSVLGIIDLEAIPDDKKDVPIGDDDNPIPLVGFVETIEHTNQGGEGQPAGKRLSGNQRRRLRKLQGATGE